MLRGELADAVGEEAAERADRKGAIDQAIDADSPHTILGVFNESRALIAITFMVALIVGAVIALVTGAWWFVLVALVLHAIGTVIVVGTAFSLASQAEHPDPRTVVALEERGVANPDAALNQAVAAAAEDEDGDGSEAERVRDESREITPSRDSSATDAGRPGS